jgi:hypothetical protein
MGYRSGPEVPIIPSGKRNVEVSQMFRSVRIHEFGGPDVLRVEDLGAHRETCMPNRIVMAAPTCMRAGSIDHVPTMRNIQRN